MPVEAGSALLQGAWDERPFSVILERTVLVECHGQKPDSMAVVREEVGRQWKPECAAPNGASSYYLPRCLELSVGQDDGVASG